MCCACGIHDGGVYVRFYVKWIWMVYVPSGHYHQIVLEIIGCFICCLGFDGLTPTIDHAQRAFGFVVGRSNIKIPCASPAVNEVLKHLIIVVIGFEYSSLGIQSITYAVQIFWWDSGAAGIIALGYQCIVTGIG